MTAQYHSVFTEKGLELVREAIQNGTKLGITHMSYGDGNGVLPVPDAKFTKMINEVYRTSLNRLAPSDKNPNWLEADGVIPSAVGGFNIREVGLWAGNVMVAYANYPPTYKPHAGEGTAQIKTIRIVLQIDNTANFELKIDASVVMATIQSVEEAKTEAKDFANQTKVHFVKTIDNLLNLEVWEGRTVRVTDDLRGGTFYYDASKSSINNGGTIIFGWTRKYFGSVLLEWFCETDPKTTSCSIYLERALSVTRSVKCGAREFLFQDLVGIPDVGQSNYAQRVIKIIGDGDTVFYIDSKKHNKAIFTSATAKANPATTDNVFVGKVMFTGINFIGVNTTRGWQLTEANKNLTDKVFDGDRLYNTHAFMCNFSHLKNIVVCEQERKDNGSSIEGGNAYSQSFSLTMNHFYHNTHIVDANALLNFIFNENMCEMNYGGIKVISKTTDNAAVAVMSVNHNLFEGGGQFINISGKVIAGSICHNYLEYNVIEEVITNQCQIGINGDTEGLLVSANCFGGQIGFTGYDTEYMDIKISSKLYNDSLKTDTSKAKAVLLANFSSSRQLNTSSRVISIGNSNPYFLKNGWKKGNSVAFHNNMNLQSPQEADVTFTRGIFNKPITYKANAINGTMTGTNVPANSLLVAILDLSKLEDRFKNTISSLSYDLDINLELTSLGTTIGNAVIKAHLGIFGTGYGLEPKNIYDNVRVKAKLLSIMQLYDIPFNSADSSNLMKKQFDESLCELKVESFGAGKYGIRLYGYTPTAMGSYGVPEEVYTSLSLTGHVATRSNLNQPGANATFAGYWW